MILNKWLISMLLKILLWKFVWWYINIIGKKSNFNLHIWLFQNYHILHYNKKKIIMLENNITIEKLHTIIINTLKTPSNTSFIPQLYTLVTLDISHLIIRVIEGLNSKSNEYINPNNFNFSPIYLYKNNHTPLHFETPKSLHSYHSSQTK